MLPFGSLICPTHWPINSQLPVFVISLALGHYPTTDSTSHWLSQAAISWLNSDSDPHSIRPTTAGQRGQSLATASAVAAAASGSGAVVAAKSGAAQLGSQKVTLSPLMIGG